MSDDEDDVLKDQNNVIEVKDGNFSWDLEKQELSLKNINVAIPQGKDGNFSWAQGYKTFFACTDNIVIIVSRHALGSSQVRFPRSSTFH